MNDQCHDCKIRKLCYMEEPKEDWTCDHYEPCEYDEEVATDINVGDKDTISRKAAIEALVAETIYTKEELKEYYEANSHRDEWVNGIYEAVEVIEQLPPTQPEQLGTNLAEVGTDCISRQAAIERAIKEHDFFRGAVTVSDKARRDELLNVMCWLGELPPAQPEIIRCKDCKHRDPEDKKCDCGHDIEWQLPRQDDWFCADAEE